MVYCKRKRVQPDSELQPKRLKFSKLRNVDLLKKENQNIVEGILETEKDRALKLLMRSNIPPKFNRLKEAVPKMEATELRKEDPMLVHEGIAISDVLNTPKSRKTNLTESTSHSTMAQSFQAKTPTKHRPHTHVLYAEVETPSDRSENSSLLSVGYSSPCEDKLSRLSGESDRAKADFDLQTPEIYTVNAELTIKMLQNLLIEYQNIERMASSARFRLIDKIQKTTKSLNILVDTSYDRKQIYKYCADLLRQINYK